MPVAVDIVGQGLAGTLLGWACADAGLEFRVWDPGHGDAASLVGAGLITPLTGQRFVLTEDFAERWSIARATYRTIEQRLGLPLWQAVRVQRIVRTEEERAAVARRVARGDGAAWIERVELERGEVWLAPAARIDLGALLRASRQRWQGEGRIVERAWSRQETTPAGATILCAGAGLLSLAPDARWRPARGETLALRPTEGRDRTVAQPGHDLADDVVRNDGHWIVRESAAGPAGHGHWRVGATYAPGEIDPTPTAGARATLRSAAARLLDLPERALDVVAQRAAIRVATADRRPIAAWLDERARLGVLGGLGSKGVLTAPGLARWWAEQLTARTH